MYLLLFYALTLSAHIFLEYVPTENLPDPDECNLVAKPEILLDESDNTILLYSLTAMVAWKGSVIISDTFGDVQWIKSDGSVQQIGRRGRGPNEFSRSVHMYLNEDILYLMEVGGSYVSKFDLAEQRYM